MSAKNKCSIAKVKNQYTMWGFAPAELEAQMCRLWWMVGFIIIICRRFCLADLREAGGLEEDGGKRRWEGRKGKGVKG